MFSCLLSAMTQEFSSAHSKGESTFHHSEIVYLLAGIDKTQGEVFCLCWPRTDSEIKGSDLWSSQHSASRMDMARMQPDRSDVLFKLSATNPPFCNGILGGSGFGKKEQAAERCSCWWWVLTWEPRPVGVRTAVATESAQPSSVCNTHICIHCQFYFQK